MKVSQAKKLLDTLNDDDDIVVAWWEHDAFDDIPTDKWADVCERVEEVMDWSHTHDDMAYIIKEYLCQD